MSLWLRFVLALLVAAVPASITMLLVVRDLEWRAREENLVRTAQRVMEAGGRERCEENPERFGGVRLGLRGELLRQIGPRTQTPRVRPRALPRPLERRRPRIEYWAYDAQFLARNDYAPVLAQELVDALRAGAESASRVIEPEDEELPIFEVALKLPWWPEGPCAALLVRDVRVPDERAFRRTVWAILGVVLASVCGVAIAAWPVVRRLRRLTDQVRGTAREFELRVDAGGRDELVLLERAFDEVHSRIREQMVELHRREEVLRSFVRNTMHDVMVPLSVLQGHLAQARNKALVGGDRESWAGAVQEAEYVRSILENLNTVAKLEGAVLPLPEETFGLSAIVERVVLRLRMLARARSIALDHGLPDVDPQLRGDAVLFEQAIGNLVHNAVQYSDSGGTVELLLEVEGDEFVLRVIDEGPGLGDDELEHVLEPRFRGEEGRTRNPSGTGLGLHIARQVAERHGCTLALRRRAERGLEAELRGPRVLAE